MKNVHIFISFDKMYTSIIPVCDSHNLTASESCSTRCWNETACCTTSLGNKTHNATHECLEFNGEGEIERCEPGKCFC